MYFNENFNFGAYGFAHSGHAINGVLLNIVSDVRAPRAWEGIELEGGDPSVNDGFGSFQSAAVACLGLLGILFVTSIVLKQPLDTKPV